MVSQCPNPGESGLSSCLLLWFVVSGKLVVHPSLSSFPYSTDLLFTELSKVIGLL